MRASPVLWWLVGCSEEPADLAERGAPPPSFEVVAGEVLAGGTAEFTAWNVAGGREATFVGSSRGPGRTCPPALGGACLDLAGPIVVLGSDQANRSGVASISRSVPATLPDGVPLWVQGVVVDPVTGVVAVSDVYMRISGPVICPRIFAPVCGVNRITYDNSCIAEAAGQVVANMGPC